MSRTKREWEDINRYITRLQDAGVTYEDAWQLRRISMTLRRWFELECGNSDSYGSWCIVRGYKSRGILDLETGKRSGEAFVHNDDGDSYMERHNYYYGRAPDTVKYTRIPDRERGAKRRLQAIMAKYPTLQAYIQTDPRGCALYILRPGDIREGSDASSCYTNGIAVF